MCRPKKNEGRARVGMLSAERSVGATAPGAENQRPAPMGRCNREYPRDAFLQEVA